MNISEESALAQVQVFLDYYEREPDESDPDALKAFKMNQKDLVRDVMKGRVEIELDASGALVITQTLKNGDKLTWAEYSGRIIAEADKAKGLVEKSQAIAGAMTSVGVNGIQRLKGLDAMTAQHIVTVFLL